MPIEARKSRKPDSRIRMEEMMAKYTGGPVKGREGIIRHVNEVIVAKIPLGSNAQGCPFNPKDLPSLESKEGI